MFNIKVYMVNFYGNCSFANATHLESCDCFKEKVDSLLIEESKPLLNNEEYQNDDGLLLRKVKTIRSDIIERVGEKHLLSNVRCIYETSLVDNILTNFKVFDLNIPTYAIIVNSVINQSLLSFRLSKALGLQGITTTLSDKFGNEYDIPNPLIDISSKIDKLIIDACDKLHKLKFGEKRTIENINNKPISINDLFEKNNAHVVSADNDK